MQTRNIKVLYLIDTLEMGGAEKSLVEISSRFINITPVFVHVYEGSSLKEDLTKNDIDVYSLCIKENYGFDKAIQSLIPLVQKIDPDIIHATLTRSVLISRKLKKYFEHIPLVNSFTSNSYIDTRFKDLSLIRKSKLRYIQWKDRRTTHRTDLFISNSEEIKKNNITALGIPPEKIKVIPRGRDATILDPERYSSDNLKKDFGFENYKIILNVGRLIKTKGQLDLIKAFSGVFRKNPQTILLIAGEGPYRKRLEEEIESQGLEMRVKLLGNRSDIPELLRMADIFAFPTYLEGLPGSLIEAMLSKKVILCSSIPENKECLPEEGGRFFPPGDIKKLSDLLEESLTNIASLESRSEVAYQHALKNFEINKVSQMYEETYHNLMDRIS